MNQRNPSTPTKNFPEQHRMQSPDSREVMDAGTLSTTEIVADQVSEVVGELPSESSTPQPSSRQPAPPPLTPEERKAQLLATLPKDIKQAEVKMRSEISEVIQAKLTKLTKEASKKQNPHRLTILIREIRHFTNLLHELVRKTFEYLQSLWLELVHNLAL